MVAEHPTFGALHFVFLLPPRTIIKSTADGVERACGKVSLLLVHSVSHKIPQRALFIKHDTDSKEQNES
jgi:hypothetical protein